MYPWLSVWKQWKSLCPEASGTNFEAGQLNWTAHHNLWSLRETAALGEFPSTPGFSFGNKTGKNLEAPWASGKWASKEGGGGIAEIDSFN